MTARDKIILLDSRRYKMQSMVCLAETLSFVNGRAVVKEEDVHDMRPFDFRSHVTSLEKAEFENGDILLVAVIHENDYSDLTPADPAYVAMYSLTRLSDD